MQFYTDRLLEHRIGNPVPYPDATEIQKRLLSIGVECELSLPILVVTADDNIHEELNRLTEDLRVEWHESLQCFPTHQDTWQKVIDEAKGLGITATTLTENNTRYVCLSSYSDAANELRSRWEIHPQ